ncbi:MAG: hypothetical protein ACRCV0_06320 [Brevinema sp.]
MLFFKILGLLLSMSPIMINYETFFFPYSFLGITMYVLAFLFDDQDALTDKSLFVILWIVCLYYIIIRISFIYNIIIMIFLITYFSFKGLTSTKNSILCIMGLLTLCIGFIIPFYMIIGFFIAAITELYTYLINKYSQTNSVLKTTESLYLSDNKATVKELEKSEDSQETTHVIPYE